ncbi:MAG TPA: DUF1592 domain-containing protein [Polyangiaceae bacterium]|nr:DUF1592 domain-containing protein [Polyangiaceae bacterium]
MSTPACSSDEPGTRPAPVGDAGTHTTGGGSGATTGGAGQSGGAGGATAAAGGATSSGGSSLLGARVRRLANPEYDASVQALLGTTAAPASGPDFPPDLRQDGFTVNDAQRVDAVIIERLADAADTLATEARANGTLARLAPCATGDEPATCAKTFVTTFGAKVYRRPLVDEEVTALLALYAAGADGADYEDGIAHVTRGLLQSAGFLYLTELGDAPPGSGRVELAPYELASALSYLLTSAPADDELLAKATAGKLAEPAEREAEARRLLANDPRARETVVRLVREWLGIDRVDDSAKDTLVYPDFEALKPSIVAESKDFVRAVAFESTGNVSELFGATWTVNSGPLALYQTAGSGPVPGSTLLDGRVGILNQAAFLATYANAHESHPIFRGVAVARRVLCLPLDSPASFDLTVVPPAPDPTQTTRQRFSVHPADSICAGCHDIIDPFGFSFEHFDGMGAYRAQENGQDVDSSVVVSLEADYDGPYRDSNAMAAALAVSPTVRECMARYMFRAAAASGDSAATAGEPEFVELWRSLPAAANGNIVESLIAYVKSPSFLLREAL